MEIIFFMFMLVKYSLYVLYILFVHVSSYSNGSSAKDLDPSRSGSDYWLLQKLSSKSLESCFLFQNIEIISASFREKISCFDESIGRIRIQKAKSWEPDSDTNFVNSNPQHKNKNLFVENFKFSQLM